MSFYALTDGIQILGVGITPEEAYEGGQFDLFCIEKELGLELEPRIIPCKRSLFKAVSSGKRVGYPLVLQDGVAQLIPFLVNSQAKKTKPVHVPAKYSKEWRKQFKKDPLSYYRGTPLLVVQAILRLSNKEAANFAGTHERHFAYAAINDCLDWRKKDALVTNWTKWRDVRAQKFKSQLVKVEPREDVVYASASDCKDLRLKLGITLAACDNLLGKPRGWYMRHERDWMISPKSFLDDLLSAYNKLSDLDKSRIAANPECAEPAELKALREKLGISQNSCDRLIDKANGWCKRREEGGAKILKLNLVEIQAAYDNLSDVEEATICEAEKAKLSPTFVVVEYAQPTELKNLRQKLCLTQADCESLLCKGRHWMYWHERGSVKTKRHVLEDLQKAYDALPENEKKRLFANHLKHVAMSRGYNLKMVFNEMQAA